MSTFLRSRAAVMAVAPALALLLAPVAASAAPSPGAVYVLGNQADGNEVLVYDRAPDGSLTASDVVATGGRGSGSSLGSQGSVILDEAGRHLFAVNAGSDTVSSFRIRPSGLQLVGTAPSGGDHPISLTVHRDVLYVLNDGGSGTISGLSIRTGALSPLAGSTRSLSGSDTAPAQVSFTPDGDHLVVSEKGANQFDVFAVSSDGTTGARRTTASPGMTPFGFGFDNRGHVIVSEAAGGGTDASSVSSYDVVGNDLSVVSASVPTTESSACWIATTGNGRYAFSANTGSNSISTFRVGHDGSLDLLTAGGRTAETAGSVADLAVSRNSQFLYGRIGNGTVEGFAIAGNGTLTPVGAFGTLPSGAYGIAAS